MISFSGGSSVAGLPKDACEKELKELAKEETKLKDQIQTLSKNLNDKETQMKTIQSNPFILNFR